MKQRIRIAVPILILFAGCTTAGQRKAAEDAAARQQVGQEITRICGLPRQERAAEIAKVQSESGMVIYCGKE